MTSEKKKKAGRRAKRTTPTRDASAYCFTDQKLEDFLLSGEHSGKLEDYFGTAGYREIRDLAHTARARSVRGGPQVLILPAGRVREGVRGPGRGQCFTLYISIKAFSRSSLGLVSMLRWIWDTRGVDTPARMLTSRKLRFTVRRSRYTAARNAA